MNPISFLTQTLRIAIPYLFAASGGVSRPNFGAKQSAQFVNGILDRFIQEKNK